eukprot:scaffold61769_cov23-Phaeocystis_antarctica.AAC.1
MRVRLPTPNLNPNPNSKPKSNQVKKACTKASMKEPPPEGYVCKFCLAPGHWVDQCPAKAAAKAEAMAKLEREAEAKAD